MGGIYIDCGSFIGCDNKPLKPLLFVLDRMKAVAQDEASALLARLIPEIKAWLSSPQFEFRITPHDAEALLPSVRQYRRDLEHVLPRLSVKEANGVDLAGPANQYRCLVQMERGFETSAIERQPVILTWD